MKINKNVNFESDLIQLYIKKYYDKYNILLDFLGQNHNDKYKKPWSNIEESKKLNYMKMFIDSKEELIKKYLDDENLNNIPISKFDYSPYYFLSLFNLKTYGLYMNACYYKGMLRDILKTKLLKDVNLQIYIIENKKIDRYILITDNKEDIKEYENKEEIKIKVLK